MACNSYPQQGQRENPKISNILLIWVVKIKKWKIGVHVGCLATYPDEFMVLNENKFVCRAIDNRMAL
jgi:putative aminopeptidase FrvX